MTEVNNGGLVVNDQEGVTLRDYFAAKAMQGILASNRDYINPNWHKKLAEKAFSAADAMLIAREAKS